MSGSFESVRWNACVHRVDLGLISYLKEFLENGVSIHVTSQEKNSLYQRFRGGSNPRHCITQDSESNTLPTELFQPPNYWGKYQPGSFPARYFQRCHISRNFRNSGYRKIHPSHPEIRRTENFLVRNPI